MYKAIDSAVNIKKTFTNKDVVRQFFTFSFGFSVFPAGSLPSLELC